MAFSPALQLAKLPPEDRAKLLAGLSDEAALELRYSWKFWARSEQRPPNTDWFYWLYIAGRGAGKTRSGAEWVREEIETKGRGHLIARTAADVRDVMIEGESGLLSIFPNDQRPVYNPSKRQVTFHNGAVCKTFSAEEPDQLRGPQCEFAWADEFASWKYLKETWDNTLMGLRLGPKPQIVVTTTPRPIKLLRELLADPLAVVTRGSTYDNAANLSPVALANLRKQYEGTTIGQQELYAAILDESPGALWSRHMLERNRVDAAPGLQRIVVGVDPAASADGAETGIVIVGKQAEQGYVIGDYTVRGSPQTWASKVVAAYHDFQANVIVAEKNQGGEMVRHTIHSIDPNVPVELVTATRGKAIRAEPVVSIYEQGRIHHAGLFEQLEDQLCTWTPEDAESPDRLDALVWACTSLFVTGMAPLATVGGVSGASYWRG